LKVKEITVANDVIFQLNFRQADNSVR